MTGLGEATLWDPCRSSPDPMGNGRTAPNSSSMRLDPTLRRFGVPALSCPMYLLGTGVRGASRLIDPRNPPRHQGLGAPPPPGDVWLLLLFITAVPNTSCARGGGG